MRSSGVLADRETWPPSERSIEVGPLALAWEQWITGTPTQFRLLAHLTFGRGDYRSVCLPGSRYRRRERPATLDRAKAAWKTLTDRIARNTMPFGGRSGEKLLSVRSIEQHRDGEHHLHALLAAPPGVPPLVPQDVLRHWVGEDASRPEFGFAEVVVVNPAMVARAVRYVVKDADRGADVMASKALALWTPKGTYSKR